MGTGVRFREALTRSLEHLRQSVPVLVLLAGPAVAEPGEGVAPAPTAPAGFCQPCTGVTGSFWSNGACDGYGAVDSEVYSASGTINLAAGDFEVGDGCAEATLTAVRVHMVVLPLDDPARQGELRLYPDAAGAPAAQPLAVLPFDQLPVRVGGILSGGSLCFVVFEYALELPSWTLAPGRYWLVPVGFNLDGTQFRLFATAGGTAVRLAEGMFRNAGQGFPDWSPLSAFTALFDGEPRDFSFELDGHCATLTADGFESGNLAAWQLPPP